LTVAADPETLDVLFDLTLDHGRAIAVALPEGDSIDRLASRLTPEEREACAAWGVPRRRTWTGGRATLRAALERAGLAAPAVLSDERGAPSLPAGVLGSISHKERVAVALVAPADALGSRIGVDVENDAPNRIDVSRKVLTERELAEVDALDPEARAVQVRVRFSAKEAIYKALDPFVRRYVGFREVEVGLRPDGGARVVMLLPPGEGAFDVDVRWMRRDGLVLTTARIRRA
jgi:4'-phosphopantetheinyl transferase EntD